MSRFEWKHISGKHVLKQDFSGLGGKDLLDALHESHETIRNRGQKEIVVMTNIKNLHFDKEVTKAFEELSQKNKEFVRESAIYGVGTIQKVAIRSVGQITGRHYNIFEDENETQKWIQTL